MKLIVGLGNPGEKYEHTRHNVGFRVLDAMLQKLEPLGDSFWEENKKDQYQFKKIKHEKEELILLKPQTFMNRSGLAVSSVVNLYKIPHEDIIIVYDDLDLPLGKIRVRFGGAAGGHKGAESIIEKLGDDKFLRVRLGIGRPIHIEGKPTHSHMSVEDFVVAPFERSEEHHAREMIHKAEKNIFTILEHGIDTYLSKFHQE